MAGKVTWTLEPHPDFEGELALYKHDEYERSSVLAGQARRQFRGTYADLAEAQLEFPEAKIEVMGQSTKRVFPEDATLEEISGLPETPPDWFDPMAAGEEW